MKNDFFTTKVIPYLEIGAEKLDNEDIKQLRKRWTKFSKLDGIKEMMVQGKTSEALEVFEFATSL